MWRHVSPLPSDAPNTFTPQSQYGGEVKQALSHASLLLI